MHTGNSSSSSARPSARGERSQIAAEPNRNAALRRPQVGLLLLIGVLVCGSAVHFRTDLHRKWDIVRSMLDRTPWYDLWVCRCHPDRDVVLARPDGLRMHASLFGLDRDQPVPGIVLVHGNTRKGRKLPIYRLLSLKLAEKGYVVLAADCVGRGESDSPFGLGNLDALSCVPGTRAAVRYLLRLAHVDTAHIAVVGHSGGATVAIDVGIEDPNVDAIVAMGPSRLEREDLDNPKTSAFFWNFFLNGIREAYHSDPPPWLTYDVWRTYSERGDLVHRIPYLRKTGHKPVLFMDGQFEWPNQVAWLRSRYDSMAPPKGYVIVPGSDHFLNTTDFGFQGSVLYDRRTIEATVGAIDRWLDSQFADRPRL